MNNIYLINLPISVWACSTICFKHDGIVGIVLYFSMEFCRGPGRRLFKLELNLSGIECRTDIIFKIH